MNHLLLAVVSVLFVECLLRLQLMRRLQAFRALLQRLLHVLRSSKISDHWKERVVPHYAGKMMLASLLLAGCLLLAVLPAIVLGTAAEFFGQDFLAWSASYSALLEATIIAGVYLYLRPRSGH